MFTNDVDLDKSKTSLIQQYKNHIELVFGVTVCVWSRSRLRDRSENGSSCDVEMSTIQLSSQFSQESLEKAKFFSWQSVLLLEETRENHRPANYIKSLIAEGEDFERFVEEISSEELNMVIENQNIVENESQAVLDIIKNSNEICIFGNRKNVSIAKNLIEKMREKVRSTETCSIDLHDFINKPHYSMCSTETFYSREKSNVFCMETTQTGSNNIPLTQRQDSVQMDCAPSSEDYPCLDSQRILSFSSFSDKETDVENNLIDKYFGKSISCISHEGDVVVSPDTESSSETFTFRGTMSSHTKLSDKTLSSSISDDENDEEVDRIIQDTSNRAKIEFALKLGYTESQIAIVIKKLGSTVGQNEMLSELIKIGMSSPFVLENEYNEREESFLSSESSIPFSCYHSDDDFSDLRPIVIDGSNVAMSHGNKEIFSCKGIQLAVDWFRQRGHTKITVFVPQWRKESSRPDARITDQEILNQLEKEKILVFTPARRIGGKRVVCYDDRYILKLAAENDGVVVSNDNYRDLINEKPEYKKVVEERLLMFSFVNDRFMPPDDPLGRHGPSLDNFLCCQPWSQEHLPPLCPYGSKKCTYGNKCKYYHPERGNIPQKSVTDKLAEQTKQKIQEVRAKVAEGAEKKRQIARKPKMALQRTKSLATELPSDLVSDKLPFDKDFQKLSMEDVIKKDPEKDEKWKQYDEKLSEHRRKLEKAEHDEKMRQEEEAKKQKDLEYLKALEDSSRSNTPSPSNRLSPSPIRPQEQFLSGHLLLAKKLSDEANDSKLRRAPEEHSYTKSPLAATQSQPLVSSPPQSTPPQPQHKKLSRQYSLQGAQDPRLKPNVRQQVSFDPNRFYEQGAYSGGLYRQSSNKSPVVHRPLDQSLLYRSGEENYQHSSNYGTECYTHKLKECEGTFLTPDSCISQHMALTRMQSAPEVQHFREQTQPIGRPIGGMMRQNSSSDTQLHIHGGETDPFNIFPQNPVEKASLTKRQDSMAYNIEMQNQNEQYRRSSSTIGQCHYQSDQSYSQHGSLSHDPRWSMPDQGYQQGYNVHVDQSASTHGYQTMMNRDTSHDFTALRSRGNQIWQNPQYVQPTPYGVHCNPIGDPFQQQRLSCPPNADFQLQSQMNTPSDAFSAQSRPIGVPILGSQSSASQTANYQPIPPTDKRYGMYYHLCALFPEPKVRAVMNQFPDVNNPQELCAYLIGAK